MQRQFGLPWGPGQSGPGQGGQGGFPGVGPPQGPPPQGSPQGFPPGPPPGGGQDPSPDFQGFGGPSIQAVDPGAMFGCLYNFTRVRLNNGRRFWFYPVFIGRTSVAGYRWRPNRYSWEYFGIDTDRISSFRC
ncbi:hypothetical protein MUO14_20205 [Halobacillus shinanisalinarum]|uniref:Transporter n=1 Tax=Halobacillus shinanisalinarum TaxID=2932258 RepID=A0ABY4GXI6_9BACI|nr:hypothetical protein [Halobacillus shinanisalinarum]UOQ92716.1 hypothetical protein MUO14_20205 [Halobacillus shinanisalinarum]